MAAAFVAIVAVSVTDRSARARRERELFDLQLVACELGVVPSQYDHHNLETTR